MKTEDSTTLPSAVEIEPPLWVASFVLALEFQGLDGIISGTLSALISVYGAAFAT
jgi:hypothetical protein